MWNPSISFRPSYNIPHSVPWFSKRKLKDDVPADLLPPPKMLITEEKMVSQLESIHLSKDFTSHGESTNSSLVDDGSSVVGLEERQALPTLVLCDEIRALQKSVEPVLPKHIMDKFHRPSNALVLWQPPVGDLGRYLKTITQDAGTSNAQEQSAQAPTPGGDVEMNEDDDNNNNEPSQDLNAFFTRTI